MRTLTAAAATEYAAALLVATGMPPAAAHRTAAILVLTEVWGIGSHGLMRLPFYLDRLTHGGCDPGAELELVTDTGPLTVYNGNDGLGHWQLWQAAERARDRCADAGVAVVGVASSSHCGALGVYTTPLVQAELVALVFSNGPAVMPPWEGTAPVLSTSPIAAGIPCRPRPAIVDLATSAVARGRIKAAALRGDVLEPGWAFTSAGDPTLDPTAALNGMLAPLGGVKGFALAFLVEALTAGLVGPALSRDIPDMFDPAAAAEPQTIAHLVLALDPARFGAGETAAARLDALARAVEAAGGRVPGTRRTLPDDLDPDTPVAVDDSVWSGLAAWSARTGVAPPA